MAGKFVKADADISFDFCSGFLSVWQERFTFRNPSMIPLLISEEKSMMNQSIDVACGFLGGTILSVEGGYRVLQHPRPERVFSRIADARWFLAVTWCDQHPTPAGILTHEGQLSFQNQAVLAVGETAFLPPNSRKAVFNCCLSLSPGESNTYVIQPGDHRFCHRVEILGLEIDPRYGKVAIIRTLETEPVT